MTTDWDAAPPLTAGLREHFPDLLRNATPNQNSPSTGNALQSGSQILDTTHRGPPAQLPPIRTHSPLFNEDHSEHVRPAVSSPLVPTAPQAHQHSHIGYQRNALGQLVPVSQVIHPSSRINSIRRRPVQSSLRNQVEPEDIPESNVVSSQSHHLITTHPSILRPGHRNQVLSCSPLPSSEPQTTPQALSRYAKATPNCSTQGHTSSIRNPTAQSGPSSHPLTLAKIRADLAAGPPATDPERSLHYDPPLVPLSPFAHHSESTASVATFDNPDAAMQPLGLLQANIQGLKQHVKISLRKYQPWKDKAANLGQRVKYHSRPFWDAGDVRAKVFWARVDVGILGSIPQCTCTVCLKKRGQDLAEATHLAHSVGIRGL